MHVAEKLRIPFFRAFTMPWTRTKVYPHPFGVSEKNLGSGYNYMTYAMIEKCIWAGISPLVNSWRKKELGLEPFNVNVLSENSAPFLYSFSSSVVS
jgi:sterol 3beta-glucosyltransferase